MPQTVILKGQTHVFAVNIVPGNITVTTTNPASGTVTYNLAGQGNNVVPLPGSQTFTFGMPVNNNTLTLINNSSSGLSCTY